MSEFSGLYKVLKVDSEFRGGKFTQTLELIRQPGQLSPNQLDPNLDGHGRATAINNSRVIKSRPGPPTTDKSSTDENPTSAVTHSTVKNPASSTTVSKVLTKKSKVSAADAVVVQHSSSDDTEAVVLDAADFERMSNQDTELAKIATKPEAIPIAESAPPTGEVVVAPTDNSKEEKLQNIAKTQDEKIRSLAARNSDIGQEIDQLTQQNDSIKAQQKELRRSAPSGDIESGTPEQQAQYAALKNQLTTNKTKINTLSQESVDNVNAANTAYDTIYNAKAIKYSTIGGITSVSSPTSTGSTYKTLKVSDN